MTTATLRARVVVDELVRGGVADAVLCPGSRNAPLSFALQDADARGLLRLHVRIDERGAGFLALGLAIATGRPVPVVTTSGTAAANLHPAVLEAAHSGIALLALTADRPADMIGTGASQTIDQTGLFGSAVRLALTAATAEVTLRAQVARALAAAAGTLGERPGPVHVNLPFAEPLVPEPGVTTPAGRPDGLPWTAVAPTQHTAAPMTLDPAAPTLVIAGSGSPDIDVAGLPVVAEPGAVSWPRAVRTGPWLLDELRPAQVIVAGRPTLHRAVQRLLADPAVAVHVLAGPDGAAWPDVAGRAVSVGALPAMTPDPAWSERWRVADATAAKVLDHALDEGSAPVGMQLARAVVAALPDGAALVLGSSNPIRDVALAAAPRPGLTVVANRGVAGIDGTVSTAAGVALRTVGPTCALLGDLTLLHDMTGLVIGPGEPRPELTMVVLNDRGGGIFSLLEQGGPAHAGAFERVFGTPHTVDLAALCAATGVRHAVTTPADVDVLLPGTGVRMIEVRAERSTLRSAHAALRSAVRDAVSSAGA